MIKAIDVDTGELQIHGFRPDDLDRYDMIVQDIYRILSNEDTLRYIPEKRLLSLHDAESWLQAAILNFHSGRNLTHFIRAKATGRLLGIVDLIPPTVAREHYQLAQYPFFLEFYLCGKEKGKSVMSRLLPGIVAHLKLQGIGNVAAVVNRKNRAASKVLQRSGFVLQAGFDPFQDLYAMTG